MVSSARTGDKSGYSDKVQRRGGPTSLRDGRQNDSMVAVPVDHEDRLSGDGGVSGVSLSVVSSSDDKNGEIAINGGIWLMRFLSGSGLNRCSD
ncbi:hypothetical protein Tco_0467889 [Tanacetum coccineum]